MGGLGTNPNGKSSKQENAKDIENSHINHVDFFLKKNPFVSDGQI